MRTRTGARAAWRAAVLAVEIASGAHAAAPDASIVVTATRGTAAPGASPTATVTEDRIRLSSSSTLETILQTMPSMGLQGVNAANAGGFGVFFVDLRNLNFNRTLTMVDGKRFVVSGINTDEAVDLNNVPLSLIDHIDILRSGSEPVFGPDAVAGVVNVVLKKNFDGVQATLYGGLATVGGDGTGAADVTWGHNFSRGNVTVNAGYFQRGAIAQASRSFAAKPITAANFAPDGSIETIIGIPATPGGHAVSADGSIDDVFYAPGQYRPFDAATDSYNFGAVQDLQGTLQRYSANFNGWYEITDGIKASLQFLYSNRTARTTMAPQALGLAGTEKNPDGFLVPVGGGGNPFDQPVELQRVMTEVGNLDSVANGYTYRLIAGLQGIVGKVEWAFYYDRGESHTKYSVYNSVNLTNAIALATCIPGTGCASADFFGPGTLDPTAADAIRFTDVTTNQYNEEVAQLTASTSLGRLQGGAVTATLGGELRSEYGYTHLDPVVIAGDQASPDSANTEGGYKSADVFLDIAWPILADKPWARLLTLDTAVRYSHFNLFGSYPTWKVAAAWAPDANVMFRGTIGLARRQPAITEAFAGLTAGLTVVQDPCDSVNGSRTDPVVNANCTAQGLGPGFVQSSPLINIASGGNPLLTPEVSHNLTAGVVLTPTAMPGLTVSADYYRYNIANAIASLADTDANFIPDTCYTSINLSNELCALIQRTASGPNAGQINRILALDSNLGAIIADGIDFDIAYTHTFGADTVLTIDWQGNYLLNYIVDEAGSSINYAGSFASLVNTGTYAHFRSLLMATVNTGGWTFGWRLHYIGGATVFGENPADTPFVTAPAVWYNDVVISYRRGNITYTLGADNVTNTRPPTLLDGLSNTNLNTYDIDGPFVYFRINASW